MRPLVLHFNPGPTHWPGGTRGWFRPKGRLHVVGSAEPFKRSNPENWSSQATWGARLIVGLNVGRRRRWKIGNIVSFVRRRWGRGASFVAQKGIWPSFDGLVQEDAVQVIILNVPSPAGRALPQKKFVDVMLTLAEDAARKFKQEEVVVEIQRNGIVKRAYGMRAR